MLCSLFPGGDQGSGFGSTSQAPVGAVVSVPSQPSASSDKYAALAELDSVFSSAATSSNAYTSTSNASRYLVFIFSIVVFFFFFSPQGG